jgi:hypothetical protein
MKNAKLLPILLVILFSVFFSRVSGQETGIKNEDVKSITEYPGKTRINISSGKEKSEIRFTLDQAIRYLTQKYKSGNWADLADPFRMAMGQLVYYASHPPADSAIDFIRKYNFDSIAIPWDKFYIWDSLKVKVPVVNQVGFNVQNDTIMRGDTISTLQRTDTLALQLTDLPYDSIGAYRPAREQQAVELKDTVFLVVSDTLSKVFPERGGMPFLYYNNPYQADSIEVALKSLSDYITRRDSSVIRFNSIYGGVVPVWLNSASGNMTRYWLKNEFSDSVTLWIGSTGRDSIGLYLEEGIMFRRPAKQTNIQVAQLNLKQINSARLQDVNRIYIKPKYWRLRVESAFVLNQALLSNWVKGGESSVSTTMDITGYADYSNKKLQLTSNNFGRIKYGLVATDKQGVRKNMDLIETNSKLNHKAFGKVDFSGTMLFKTQMTVGRSYFKYNEKDTSVVASKFMNPATLTIGFGLDYKPNKTTSINFAPFTYKGTFVTDTAKIDQTKYGIPADKKSLNEPGVSLQVMNEFKPCKTITITNRIQLFTNYIHNPQNIDVDWEMIATAKLNWFTEVRLNTQLIYDDDTKTARLDENDNPIMGTDGKPVKSARVQFKELIGFSFVFRF